ncbi:hypothetical protein BG006_002034 [Podila minutissima]|uniref:Uncharacterized protein n=1 Tax=Podila minutissima TaxID=64525 RepID=A0A9P5SCG6_9FUNG|nr:hypothetical protein BG006_002034 [Podila minutissima]
MATIADPVMDEYPLLLDLLKGMVNLVCGVPERYRQYLVDSQTYHVLQFANENVVNIQLKDLPAAKGDFFGFGKFMSTLTNDDFVRKVRYTFRSKLYDGRDPPPGAIAQPSAGLFPSLEWIINVWILLHRPDLTEATLKPLLGCHLVPSEGGPLAPLDRSCQVIDRSGILPNSLGADRVLDLLGTHLECYVVRSGLEDWFSWWSQCFVSVADIGAILWLLAYKSSATFAVLTPPQRQLLFDFVSATLFGPKNPSADRSGSLLSDFPSIKDMPLRI